MTDVIIIRPISHSWDKERYYRYVTIPHGPLTLASHLVKKGISVKIIDEVAEVDAENKLRKYLTEHPVCVGISTMTGKQIENGLRFASIVREFDKDIPLVWGGAHPTILPLMTLEDTLVDIVVYGEGDISFPMLVQRLKNKKNYRDIKGICYKTNNKELVKNDPQEIYDLNETPKMPYSLIDMEKYITDVKKKYITRYFEVISSKGCPFKCAFCYNSTKQSLYSKKDTKKMIEEVKYLIDNYHIDGLSFEDENFILGQKRLIGLCEELIKSNIRVAIRAGGRIDLFSKFDDSVLGLMKEAGFYFFGFGVESGSQKTLDMINKEISLDQVYNVVSKINKFGFEATYNFMGGFPNEDLSEYKKTLKLMYYIFQHSKKIIYPVRGPSYYTPFPGTVLYHKVVELGYSPPKTFREWSELDYTIPKMTWLTKEFKEFLINSRGIVNDINQKFTGEGAVITDEDLYPLKEIME